MRSTGIPVVDSLWLRGVFLDQRWLRAESPCSIGAEKYVISYFSFVICHLRKREKEKGEGRPLDAAFAGHGHSPVFEM